MLGHHPQGTENILSLHNVQKKYKVTCDSSLRTGFVVHKSDGTECMFKPSKKGLFFSDVKQEVAHLLVNTVDSIKKYAVKAYTDAYKTWSLQDIIGRPSTRDYIKIYRKQHAAELPHHERGHTRSQRHTMTQLRLNKGHNYKKEAIL